MGKALFFLAAHQPGVYMVEEQKKYMEGINIMITKKELQLKDLNLDTRTRSDSQAKSGTTPVTSTGLMSQLLSKKNSSITGDTQESATVQTRRSIENLRGSSLEMDKLIKMKEKTSSPSMEDNNQETSYSSRPC